MREHEERAGIKRGAPTRVERVYELHTDVHSYSQPEWFQQFPTDWAPSTLQWSVVGYYLWSINLLAHIL